MTLILYRNWAFRVPQTQEAYENVPFLSYFLFLCLVDALAD